MYHAHPTIQRLILRYLSELGIPKETLQQYHSLKRTHSHQMNINKGSYQLLCMLPRLISNLHIIQIPNTNHKKVLYIQSERRSCLER